VTTAPSPSQVAGPPPGSARLSVNRSIRYIPASSGALPPPPPHAARPTRSIAAVRMAGTLAQPGPCDTPRMTMTPERLLAHALVFVRAGG
jgi:hypothetical protein